MKITEFATWLTEQLEARDHDEIVSVENKLNPEHPNKSHVLARISYANEGSSTIMVQAVRGPGIPKHERYAIPREAF